MNVEEARQRERLQIKVSQHEHCRRSIQMDLARLKSLQDETQKVIKIIETRLSEQHPIWSTIDLNPFLSVFSSMAPESGARPPETVADVVTNVGIYMGPINIRDKEKKAIVEGVWIPIKMKDQSINPEFHLAKKHPHLLLLRFTDGHIRGYSEAYHVAYFAAEFLVLPGPGSKTAMDNYVPRV